MTASHFRVSKRAADALGVAVLNVMQHCVVVRTERGPRFMSRRLFDAWEHQQRLNKARTCLVKHAGNNVWQVVDQSTVSGEHTVIRTGLYAKGIEGKWACTCTDAHFMQERNQEPCCKHIAAVHLLMAPKIAFR